MHEKTRQVLIGVAVLAAAGGITAGIAGAARDGSEGGGDRPGAAGRPGPPHGTVLSGDAKAKAEAAALEAVPGGEVLRSFESHHESAAYVVIVEGDDGDPVAVLLDEDFGVVAERPLPAGGPRPGGPGGPHHGAPLTGDAAEKAKAAALAAVPGGVVRATFAAPEGKGAEYAAFVVRKSGRPVVVLLDEDFEVVGKVAPPRFGPRGGHPGTRPGFRPGGPPPGRPS